MPRLGELLLFGLLQDLDALESELAGLRVIRIGAPPHLVRSLEARARKIEARFRDAFELQRIIAPSARADVDSSIPKDLTEQVERAAQRVGRHLFELLPSEERRRGQGLLYEQVKKAFEQRAEVKALLGSPAGPTLGAPAPKLSDPIGAALLTAAIAFDTLRRLVDWLRRG